MRKTENLIATAKKHPSPWKYYLILNRSVAWIRFEITTLVVLSVKLLQKLIAFLESQELPGIKCWPDHILSRAKKCLVHSWVPDFPIEAPFLPSVSDLSGWERLCDKSSSLSAVFASGFHSHPSCWDTCVQTVRLPCESVGSGKALHAKWQEENSERLTIKNDLFTGLLLSSNYSRNICE